MGEAEPGDALRRLASILREEGPPVADHVVGPREDPVLGLRAARGPRAAQARGDYALVVESIREGYLLHHGDSRLLSGHDEDLALLAGDYLYALGIERLSRLGDPAAVLALADLISECSRLHAEGRSAEAAAAWERATAAVGGSAGDG